MSSKWIKRYLVVLLMLTYFFTEARGMNDNDTVPQESTVKRSFFHRIGDYFSKSNKPDTTKRFDITFIGGPSYSAEQSLSVAVMASALYKKHPADTTLAYSLLDVYGKVSVIGYYKVGFDGIHYFGDNNKFLVYDVGFESAPDKYWGVGYEMDNDDGNMSKYKRLHVDVDVAYIQSLGRGWNVGPHIVLDYLNAKNPERPENWAGMSRHTFTDALGVKVEYDTRDLRYNAKHGVYASIDQMFAPRFLGNRYAFSLTDCDFRYYHPLWKGCTLATNLRARFTYGNTPWGLMSKIGGSYNMRGYWEGRYNDKCAADMTVEFRQHLYRRVGMVAWGGVGEVFGKPTELFKGKPLPNYGIGFRWEFKKNINIRIDYGWGKNQSEIVFNMNEAF